MKENGVAVNDLYSFALPQLADWQLPVNVHFKETGSAGLGREVARVILGQLKAGGGE
jgi:acyl-CoA thioesterase-1